MSLEILYNSLRTKCHVNKGSRTQQPLHCINKEIIDHSGFTDWVKVLFSF